MKVGVLGSGMVAKTLATGFAAKGHDVMVGTRTAAKVQDWIGQAGGKVGSFAEAARHGELLVLAVKGTAAQAALTLAGSDALQRKVVIDTCNPIADAPPVHGVLQFTTSLSDSLLEQLQRAAPQARLVKAWSSVGNAHMVDPDFGGVRPTMFICGNDAEARKTVAALLDTFGWDTADMGMAEAARAIEPLCMLWCIPGFQGQGWNHAFHLLRR